MSKTYAELRRDLFSNEFNHFCEKEISNSLIEVEKSRHKYLYMALGIFLVWLVFISFVIYGLFLIKDDTSSYSYSHSSSSSRAKGDVLGFSIALLGLAYIPIRRYKKKAKKIVLPKILSFIGDFKIIENNSSAIRGYIESLEITPNHNRFSCDDHFVGNYNNLDLEIAEICLKTETNNGRNRSTVINFRGLFVKFKSLKNFNVNTLIKKDGIKIFNSKKRVVLEDPEFEKIYDVFSDDQIEARYLLTPAFMNRLIECHKKKPKNFITLSFEQGNVNLYVESKKDLFEMPILKSATDVANYREILTDILIVFSIIDAVKLDQNL